MDGIEATQLHRFGTVGDKHLPILAMTADATPEMAQRCIEAGMDVCIVKPVAPSRLLDIIDGFAPTSAKANPVITPNNAEQAASARKAKAPVNPAVLKDLEMLGGLEFMAQIAQQFMQDASGLLVALRRAAELGETAAFQAQAHALSGLAANIGADAVLAICAKFGTLNLSDRSSCQVEMLSLKIELERVQQTLRQHVAGIR
jgi:two-component system sensor histidine kinase RpfC